MRHSAIRRVRGLVASLAGAGLIAVVVPAAAGAACAAKSTSPAFAAFGDESAYSLVAGGSFESGAPGWSLNGASVIDENESFDVTPGSHSLGIESGGVAASPWVCISSEYPTFRFFARRLGGGASSTLDVSLRWIDVLGIGVDTTVGSLQSGGSWAPSPVLRLGKEVPLWMPGGTLQVGLVFQPSWGSSWTIDDVYIDPYRR